MAKEKQLELWNSMRESSVFYSSNSEIFTGPQAENKWSKESTGILKIGLL